MKYKKFNKLVLLSIFITFISTILFNFIIDPYYVFNTFKLKGVNTIKNNSISEEITKFYTARLSDPSVLLIGTSRTECINPMYLQKYFPDDRIYNLAIPGSGVSSQKNNIEYFIKHKDIKAIVYGLDFFAFNPINNNFEIKEDRYSDNYTKDRIDSLLGMRTLRKSFMTLKENIKNEHSKRDYSNGCVNNNDEYLEISKNGDQYISKNIDRIIDKYSSAKTFYNYAPFKKSNSINDSLTELQKIIQLCNNYNVKLYIFISPINTRLTDLIYKMELEDTYQHWKKELSKYENIYDFSGYNTITTDLSNYIDGSHYQTKLAPLMFAKMFNDKSVDVPADFGIILNAQNIENILIEQNKKAKK